MIWAGSFEKEPWLRFAARSAMDNGTWLDLRFLEGRDAASSDLIGIYAIIYDEVSLSRGSLIVLISALTFLSYRYSSTSVKLKNLSESECKPI
jgi:hypothetical protein